MNNIAIIDADVVGNKYHRFPNLACMKISSYHKKLNDKITLLLNYENLEIYDKVYISKVFTDTPIDEKILELPNVEYGGTGFFYDKAKPLSDEIEHIMPDYNLYNEFVKQAKEQGVSDVALTYYTDYSIGFMTRGCIRKCSFCVNKNYNECLRHSQISEFLDINRKYICLLDDNVLACKHWREIFNELNNTNKRFQFKQGLDERLLTKEKCEMIFNNSNWLSDFIFAFDNIKDKEIIEEKLKLIRSITRKRLKFYTFCGYNHDAIDLQEYNEKDYNLEFWEKDIIDLFERLQMLSNYGAFAYVMRHKNYEKSPDIFKGLYITITRYCNQIWMCKKGSLREFCQHEQNVNKSKTITSSLRHLNAFEKIYPEIAKKYFDINFKHCV